MTRVLFVTNGHGEVAIADRIAAELHAIAPDVEIDHLALVGTMGTSNARDVGPRARMPSGGLIAMGNVTNIARDLRAGLVQLTLAQWAWLRAARGTYALVVATGDSYALWMALRAGAATFYVGTAKSVLVAPYGPGERRLLRRAREIFVRDDATAARLRTYGLHAKAPGNAIVDLFASGDPASAEPAVEGFSLVVALLPGSRERAYGDAASLVNVFTRVAKTRSEVGGVLSLAPGIDAGRMSDALQAFGSLSATADPNTPFSLNAGERVMLRAWNGDVGALLKRSALVLGQAGTANEAAAAAGIPVAALARDATKERGWYRERQSQLLGDALVTLSPDPATASRQLGDLIDDPERRARCGAAGRTRMGPPGGARHIAERIAAAVGNA